MKPIKFFSILVLIVLVSCSDESNADKTQPFIRLNGKRIDTASLNSIYKDEKAEADGCNDVVASGSVNTSVPGTYYIEYDYTDPHGNRAATVTRTVHVLVSKNDSVQIKKAFSLYDRISISKHWRTSEKDGKEISINLKTQPVIYLDFKVGATISSYKITDIKNIAESLELRTEKLISDSIYIWNYKPTESNKGVWSMQNPQINHKIQLGTFTSVQK